MSKTIKTNKKKLIMLYNIFRRYLLGVFLLLCTSDIHDCTTGKHLAVVDFSACYRSGQTEAEQIQSLSSFQLLHISQDLSTAVAVTSQKEALALDLNDYFRYVWQSV